MAGDAGISVPKWIPDERRLDVGRLKSLFPKLFENLQLEDQSLWQGFGQSDEEGLPVQLSKKVTPFQQVLLFQVFDLLFTLMSCELYL